MAWTNENGIERSLSWKALFLSYVAYLNSRGCSILLIVTLSHQCTVKLWVLMEKAASHGKVSGTLGCKHIALCQNWRDEVTSTTFGVHGQVPTRHSGCRHVHTLTSSHTTFSLSELYARCPTTSAPQSRVAHVYMVYVPENLTAVAYDDIPTVASHPLPVPNP